MKEPAEAIIIISRYEDILKTQNKKIINIFGKQGRISLKKIRETEGFFETVVLICSNIYFKFRLYKFLNPYLADSALALNYFETYFKLIKKVCMDNAGLFGKENYCFHLFLLFLLLSCCKIREFCPVWRNFFCSKNPRDKNRIRIT